MHQRNGVMNQEIKGNLARLLATENLIVEHLKVSTASFDVDRRVLTLPNWDRASSTVYDMLVGHEVGHALFTPNEDWRDVADCPKDFVNVIEDARIEKLMKRKYPGLRKSFAGGYRELNDHDFFAIADEDVSKFSLIDRINLHFKIGASAMIPFSIEEKVFVARTDLAETFEEVLQIAVDVHQFSNKVETPMTHEEMLEEAAKRENENSEDTDNEQSNTEGQNFGEDETDYDEEYEEEYPEDEIQIESSGSAGGETSRTQRSFDSSSEKLTNKNVSNPRYVEIPEKVNLENYIVDWSELHNWIDTYREQFLNCDNAQWDRSDSYEFVDQSYNKFRKESQKEVNYLVKEFECRKSADAYARSGQSKTGVLDTSKLHTFMYNEDLFKKVTVVPDGKNHGLLFVLDWSGSMANELLATVKQLLNLTAFCKKVQIPFEVYAFTNEWCIAKRVMSGEDTGYYYYSPENYRELCNEGEIFLHEGRFHMLNVISSRSNSKNYERMCLNLFREAFYFTKHVTYHSTPGVGLSGTPLNEAIVMMNYIIPNFKFANDIQKVNVCVLTDGESCQSAYGRKYYDEVNEENYVRPTRIDYNVILRDRKTGRVYNNANGWWDMTNTLIKQVRDRNYGVNVLGFRIMPGSALSNFVSTYGDSSQYEQVQREWKKTKSAIIPMPKGYTALYAISNNAIDTETEFDVESGAKKGEISRAFKKMLKSKSTNKKLLNSFVEYVA